MSEVFKIKKFDIENIKQNKNILIIGPKYSGKSHLLKDILYYIDAEFAVLINPNEFATNFYGKVLPEQCKQDELTNELLEKICNRQKTLIEYRNKHRISKRDMDIQSSLIMDNCVPDLMDLKWQTNKFFKFLFRSGTDAELSTIFTAPYPLKIPDHYIPSIDYVFILRDSNNKNKKKIYDMFCGMFNDFKKFQEVMNTCTQKYSCLVVDRTKVSSDSTDAVYWYRAPEKLQDIHLGGRNLWKILYKTKKRLDELLVKPIDLFKY